MIQNIYSQIQQQTPSHSVLELCSVFNVSRSGYYKWLKRGGLLNRYEQLQNLTDSYVADLHVHNVDIVYRLIRDSLQLQFCLKLSFPTVWRSMIRLVICGYTIKLKLPTNYGGIDHFRFSNIL